MPSIHDRPVRVLVQDLSSWIENVGYTLAMLEMDRAGPKDIERLRRVASSMVSILQPVLLEYFDEMARNRAGR